MKEKTSMKVVTAPASVGTGLFEEGFAASKAGLVGPGSLALRSDLGFWPDCSCAASFFAESKLAAARAADLAPRNPLRVNASFFASSPMPATFLNRNGFRLRIRNQT